MLKNAKGSIRYVDVGANDPINISFLRYGETREIRRRKLKMKKHAYLIIAHKDDYTFYSLLNALDDERNDLFIHMDCKNKGYIAKKAEQSIRFSRVYHTERTKVTWGAYSQINAELLLIKAALGTGYSYSYYHLLSGEDLPIKTQDEIHNFFDANHGKEFVRFQSEMFSYYDRVQYWQLFRERIGRGNKHRILLKMNSAFIRVQNLLGIKRNKEIRFQKGDNWFSITNRLAQYVVKQEKWIKKTFSYTFCADEIFLQTIVHNSEFRHVLYHEKYDDNPRAIMRLIDWNRGNPYTFLNTDRQELLKSDMQFARKFNCEVDREIIDYISSALNCTSPTIKA